MGLARCGIHDRARDSIVEDNELFHQEVKIGKIGLGSENQGEGLVYSWKMEGLEVRVKSKRSWLEKGNAESLNMEVELVGDGKIKDMAIPMYSWGGEEEEAEIIGVQEIEEMGS